MDIKKFGDLVGNSLVISLIIKGLKNKTLPNFILLSGVHGSGKSSSAELMAMALTCENPVNGEACDICDTCKKNRLALKPGGGGISPRVEKVNMALVSENRSMKDILNATFQIVRSGGKHVKIFEEFHQLSKEDQGLMLEETSRISSNVVVILTTTHPEEILDEMVSRCLTFSFGRLNKGETALLVDRVNKKLKMRESDYDIIHRKTDGIPRNIVLLVEFLSANNPTPEEVDALLGNIDRRVFIDLLNNASVFRLYMDIAGDLMSAHPADLILNKLIDFFTDIIFAVEGKIFDVIPEKTLNLLPVKKVDILYKVLKLVEETKADEQGLKLMFLKMRRLLSPAMAVSDQKLSAEISGAVKGVAGAKIPATAAVLTRFNGG